MVNFLATIWSLIGILVGILVLFLVIVGVGEMIAEAVRTKRGRK